MNRVKTIYAIQHNVTKRIYIGSTQNVRKRYFQHISKLRNGKHSVEDMQKDFDQYGEDYALFILEEINGCGNRAKEYEWMRKYRSDVRGIGYNYKDQAREKIRPSAYPLRRNELPSVSDDSQFTLIDTYIKQIIEAIQNCADIDLLDLILKILIKE